MFLLNECLHVVEAKLIKGVTDVDCVENVANFHRLAFALSMCISLNII